MKMLGLILLILVCAFAGFLVYISGPEHIVHQASTRGFILREQQPSPDGRHAILRYAFDGGGLGTSRDQLAVVPTDYNQLNLAEYIIPEVA